MKLYRTIVADRIFWLAGRIGGREWRLTLALGPSPRPETRDEFWTRLADEQDWGTRR